MYLAKYVVVLVSRGLNEISSFLAPPGKILGHPWKNPLSLPTGKNPSDDHHLFGCCLRKNFCNFEKTRTGLGAIRVASNGVSEPYRNKALHVGYRVLVRNSF